MQTPMTRPNVTIPLEVLAMDYTLPFWNSQVESLKTSW